MGKVKWIGIVRIVGLCLVLIYHFFTDKLAGGFIGVDVFFTFSGYLITALAVSETQRKGGFSLRSFFKRRARRIYPSFVMSVALVLPFALLISADFRSDLIRQVSAAFGFVTNFYEIQTGGSYEAKLLPHLFVHTWSLAVEVQLYILWAFVCKLLAAAGGGRPRVLKGLFAFLSIELAIASYLYMRIVYGGGADEPSFVYFNTLTRAYPFFIGSAAGALFGMDIGVKHKKALSQAKTHVIGVLTAVCGVAGLVLLSLTLDFTSVETYKYGILFASLFTVILICSLRILHEATPAEVNEPKLVSRIADMSYLVFLIHWPLYVVFSNVRQFDTPLAVFGVSITLTFILSAFIHHIAEPCVSAWHNKNSVKPRFKYAVSAFVFAFAFSLSGYTVKTSPAVSSLENEQTVGYLYQDTDKLYDIKRSGDSVNEPPVILAFNTPLENFGFWDYDYNAVSAYARALAMEAERQKALERQQEIDRQAAAQNEQEPPQGSIFEQGDIPVIPAPPPRPIVVRPHRELNAEGIPEGVFIIGDSVCLGARKALLEEIEGCEVDAMQNRQMRHGHAILLEMQEEGLLPEYIVVALGTNTHSAALDSVDAIIRDINPGHRLIFVTPYNGGVSLDSITYQTAAHIRSLPEYYPFVTVADWAGTIGYRDHVIGADRIHIGGNRTAIGIYVETIKEALAEAALKPAIGEELLDETDETDETDE